MAETAGKTVDSVSACYVFTIEKGGEREFQSHGPRRQQLMVARSRSTGYSVARPHSCFHHGKSSFEIIGPQADCTANQIISPTHVETLQCPHRAGRTDSASRCMFSASRRDRRWCSRRYVCSFYSHRPLLAIYATSK